jgi:cytochrome c1
MRTAVLAIACLAVACHKDEDRQSFRVATGGDPDRGREHVIAYGCPACHDIPGIRAPGGLVGPPLRDLARRTYVAGHLPNTPGNLVRWIRDPHAVSPGTAMPTLGLSEEEARDVAAYLYTF